MLLGADDVRRAISRIAHEIVERDRDLSSIAIIGIRSRGDVLAARLRDAIRANENATVPLGSLDITLYRDDLTRIGYAPIVHESALDFSVDDKVVVLVDDVLFTGRTIRADFVGKNVPTKPSDDVRVHLTEVDGRDEVELIARERVSA